jgi:hypothetical protein
MDFSGKERYFLRFKKKLHDFLQIKYICIPPFMGKVEKFFLETEEVHIY